MNETSKGLMYWTPRVLCIAFAALLAAFAADVFDMPLNVWEKAIALAMHLVPSLMVLVVLAVAWRHRVDSGHALPRCSQRSIWC